MIPSIYVEFLEKARTAINRSKKGILCVICPETTAKGAVTLTSAAQIDATSFSDANKVALHYAFMGATPKKVIAIGRPTTDDIPTIGEALDKTYADWYVAAHGQFQQALVEYVKNYNTNPNNARRINAVLRDYDFTTPIDKTHFVNVAAQDVYVDGTRVTPAQYLPRIAAEICACPIDQSVTYKVFPEITKIGLPDHTEGSIYFVRDDDLYRMSTVVAADGTTKIAVIAAQDMIREDICNTFKNRYLGKVRNSPANQANYCADIYGYLTELSKIGVINPEQPITVEIDTEKMREAWADKGVDVSDLSDAEIRNKIVGSHVYVLIRCTILDAMEDLTVSVVLD